MSLLSATQLTAMRTTAQSTFTDTVVVKRRATVGGVAVGSYATVATTTGRLVPLSGSYLFPEHSGGMSANEWTTQAPRQIRLPYGTDVQNNDHLGLLGKTWVVLDVDGQGTWSLDLKATVQELR